MVKIQTWFGRLSVFSCIFAAACVFAAMIAAIEHAPVYLFLRAALFAIWIAVLLRYGPAAWGAFVAKNKDMGAGEHLILGIWFSISGSLMLGAFLVSQRLLNYPDWMRDWWFLKVILAWQIVGGVLHLTAPGAIGGQVPRLNWGGIALALTLAGALAAVLMLMSVAV